MSNPYSVFKTPLERACVMLFFAGVVLNIAELFFKRSGAQALQLTIAIVALELPLLVVSGRRAYGLHQELKLLTIKGVVLDTLLEVLNPEEHQRHNAVKEVGKILGGKK